jgi:hypothetical protein
MKTNRRSFFATLAAGLGIRRFAKAAPRSDTIAVLRRHNLLSTTLPGRPWEPLPLANFGDFWVGECRNLEIPHFSRSELFEAHQRKEAALMQFALVGKFCHSAASLTPKPKT